MDPKSLLSGIRLIVSVVWSWTEAVIGDLLTPRTPSTDMMSRLPTEILEMIIAHLIHDTPSLKACAATCLAWCNVATPHLHHTLTLRQSGHPGSLRTGLGPLLVLNEFGLLPLVRKLQFRTDIMDNPWVVPGYLDSLGLRCFSALANIQSLTVERLDFSKFEMGLEKYSNHFSPTLRSVTLCLPDGTLRQLLDFLRLFPKLDNIELRHYRPLEEAGNIPEAPRAPVWESLRGGLTLYNFVGEEELRNTIAAFGGIRFTSMDLYGTPEIQLLLKACGGALRILRLHSDSLSQFSAASPQLFHLSHNTALQSLEFQASNRLWEYGQTLNELLHTITSPAFSEIVVVFDWGGVYRSPQDMAGVFREMYKIRRFRLVFCLETPGALRVSDLQALTVATRREVTRGSYDFLPWPPLVCSRVTTEEWHRFKTYT